MSHDGDAGVHPVDALFSGVIGQPRAVTQLKAAARHPVHAYLLFGPPGSGRAAAARGLAAALLCAENGCGNCPECRRALSGLHPDVVEYARTGATLTVEDAGVIRRQALMKPVEGDRQILVVRDIQSAVRSAPALLKTIEEPPPGTIFVLLADDLPAEMATIVSRCVLIRFDAVPEQVVARWLVEQGVDPDLSATVAAASGGRLDRARLMSEDPGFAHRQRLWRSVAQRLDGTGTAVCELASELLAATEEGLAPLRARHAQELAALVEQSEAAGQRGVAGRKQIDDRMKREERRWRTDDLRFGLTALAEEYRDRLLGAVAMPQPGAMPVGAPERRRMARHLDAIHAASAALDRNVNELLLLDGLLVELSDLDQ